MKRAPHAWRCALLLAAALTPGCEVDRDASAGTAAPTAPVRTPLATVTGTLAEVPSWLPLTGQLRGNRETDLAANANGRVTATFASAGRR